MDPAEYEAESVASPELDRASKRRKLRKGTTSCWDCKKRKVKCTFDATSETECIACRRRGLVCMSQDQPEEVLQAHDAEVNRDTLVDRMHRVESLLEQLLGATQELQAHNRNLPPPAADFSLGRRNTDGYFTPASTLDYPSCPSVSQSQGQSSQGIGDTSATTAFESPGTSQSTPRAWQLNESTTISEELVKAFPPQDVIDMVCKSDPITTFECYRIFTKYIFHSERDASQLVDDISTVPDPSTRSPVFLAKRMILLALFVQYFRSQHSTALAEHLSIHMNKLMDTASHLVTTNENLVACADGVECIILEGIFQSNSGNLRRAWLAFRKATVIAQLMKMDHPNPPILKSLEPGGDIDPKMMWFRIIRMDTHLSLMLGLSHGGQEIHLERETHQETASSKLERIHTLISRQIIDRNKNDPALQDFTTTRKLDQDLLNLANSLPEEFWLPPNFSIIQPNTREALEATMRLCDQLNHFNLLHLLHLPYLLRTSPSLTHAKITCINASREILTRVISFRIFNRKMATIYCRTADFYALMASMTLLLLHIDSHRLSLSEQDWRAHQRLSDRAIVHQLLSTLEETRNNTNDHLTTQTALQLRRLLEIESDTARGVTKSSAHAAVSSLEEQCAALRLEIPYFGIINIGSGGFGITQTQQAVQPLNDPHGECINGEEIGQQHQQSMPEFQQVPGLVAGIDDWAFQGVDGAFFESLMRGSVGWE